MSSSELTNNRTDQFWDARIETLPRVELERLQLRLLKEHIAFAAANSTYYKQAFAECGVSVDDVTTLDDLERFPFITKQALRERQTAAPLLGDICAVPERDVVYISASSGSTGVPTLSPFTAADFDSWQDVQARLFYAAGMRNHDRYLHALNFSLFVGGPDVIAAQRVGALSVWAGTVPADRLLYLAKELQPTVTWTTPSYAWYLGETALSEGIDPARDLAIRTIIVAGEPGGSIPATRKAIETLWNAELYDFYGISDIFGACSGMCSEREGLHIAEDHLLVEVLDPVTGERVPDGEKGEMVLTTLQKQARPMLRFRTGDIITRNALPCRCGRTHARIWIHGRSDDMFIVNGVNLFPSDVEIAVRTIPEVTGEYRITLFREQHLTRFTLDVERRSGSSLSDGALAEKIRHLLRNRHGIAPHSVSVFHDGTLPRAVHKAKRVIDNR